MSNPTPRRVRCPICADDYPWPDDPTVSLYDEEKDEYQLVDVSTLTAEKQADLARRGYRECPNPSGDTPQHYLPATYVNYLDPLVIGLVGAPASGKTHLLTAMIRQAYMGGLRAHRITTAALDFRRHAHFRNNYIEPFEKGDALPGTGVGVVEAADILLLRGPGGERPVTFFDVAGEDLESTAALNRATRFLVGANAVIFVYAPEDPLETKKTAASSENRSFALAVERLQSRSAGTDRLPVAVAVTKSDRLRYVTPADRWLRRGDEQVVDATRIRAESRDAFSYLHHVGAGASLRPFEAFNRCTLHFVSASGGDAVPVEGDGQLEKHFARGVHPVRVLEPLVSILAMTGMITGPEAGKVGMP
jgi:GTPase SAR1 family protein